MATWNVVEETTVKTHLACNTRRLSLWLVTYVDMITNLVIEEPLR